MFTVYILQSIRNNRFYIGNTNNLDRRIEEHNAGKSKYTSEVLPLVVVFKQNFPTMYEAQKAESWLKRMKSRVLLERIILEGVITKTFG